MEASHEALPLVILGYSPAGRLEIIRREPSPHRPISPEFRAAHTFAKGGGVGEGSPLVR